ncbi:hypothetical protein DF153_05310 [Burkholderia cenocepacia]|uniref:hypothetical protein n=1 Tax=Burkholderia sp. AU28863 TaxID=2015352 RepID=UPI000B7A4B5C|nr:hypothetical protein [Burkholderia sp. AU28863]OXI66387.1 hypothetical protein CFB81_16585 [Burkholderia sp. AU28863]RQU14931.1 hypothetical protein DF152_16325 [Burkholderia cenocepacia]RQU28498.1 hypothetical protein DF153_05310 [Burkholderia cenocepacia]
MARYRFEVFDVAVPKCADHLDLLEQVGLADEALRPEPPNRFLKIRATSAMRPSTNTAIATLLPYSSR